MQRSARDFSAGGTVLTDVHDILTSLSFGQSIGMAALLATLIILALGFWRGEI